MKLSKTLLQAIALGVALGTTSTSCSLADQSKAEPNLHSETCDANCEVDHSNDQGNHTWENCPACGMG